MRKGLLCSLIAGLLCFDSWGMLREENKQNSKAKVYYLNASDFVSKDFKSKVLSLPRGLSLKDFGKILEDLRIYTLFMQDSKGRSDARTEIKFVFKHISTKEKLKIPFKPLTESSEKIYNTNDDLLEYMKKQNIEDNWNYKLRKVCRNPY